MKQRLALAIALMNDPHLLLVDEPSNGLDPIGIIQLRDLLKQLRDAGAAIVISSHRLGELEKMTCDYLFMHRGRIISLGDEILPVKPDGCTWSWFPMALRSRKGCFEPFTCSTRPTRS